MSARILLKSNQDTSKHPRIFEFNPETLELCRNQTRIGFLAPQSATLLNLLLSKEPGQLTTMEEITSTLWPNESTAPLDSAQRIRELVRGLRLMLGDTKEQRQFIENIPRKGYRFLGQIDRTPVEPPPSQPDPVPPPSVDPPPVIDAASHPPSPPKRTPTWTPAALAGLLLLTAAIIVSQRIAHSPSPSTHSELLWKGPSPFRLGDVSRDGKLLCYSDGKTEELQVRNLATGSTTTLSARPPKSVLGGVKECIISDDGNRIAFRRDMGESQGIYVGPIHQPGHPLLYTHPQRSFWITDWSPDGRRIAAILCSSNSTAEIWQLDANSGAISSKHPVARCPFTAKFSPDGRSIAYDGGVDAQRTGDIFVAMDNGPAQVASSEPGAGRLVDWTQDGSGLVYTGIHAKQTESDIRYVPFRPGHPPQPSVVLVSNPAISKALGIAADGALYYANGSPQRHIYTAEIDVEKSHLLTPAAFHADRQNSDSLLDWAPKGDRLCAVSYNGRNTRVAATFLKITDGQISRTLELNHDLPNVTAIHWAPDGQSILASGLEQGGSGVFKVNSSTGEITRLRWSPDPKSTFYSPSQSAFNNAIYFKKRVFEREPSPLIRMSTPNPSDDQEIIPSVYSYRLSADGRQLVYSTFDPNFEFIRLVDLATNQTRELHREPREGRIVSVTLTPDSRYVLYAKRGQLWKLPTSGGNPQMLPLNMPALRDLSIHPNGTKLAFMAGDPDASDLWVMKNFLPPHLLSSRRKDIF